jgi:ankyrin repeat protein
MIIAAQEGQETVVRALLEAGADVNQAMDNGGTPLNVAAQNGHAAIVRALIDLGADFNNATDNGGTPPLKRATMRSFRFSGMPARRDE